MEPEEDDIPIGGDDEQFAIEPAKEISLDENSMDNAMEYFKGLAEDD